MNDNKRIAYNSVYIFFRLCIVSLVSIIASRIVLDALGASDYGLYNVVGGIVALLNVVNMAMSSATYRFIATEMGKGENGQLNKVFNVSLTIHFVFALVILLLGVTLGEYYVDHWLNVDPSKLSDARFVFYVSLATTCFATIMVPYNGLLVAYEEFLAVSIFEVLASIMKLTAIFTVLLNVPNRLICYSFIMMGTVVINHGGRYLYSFFRYRDVIRIKRYREKTLYREVLSFSGWTSLGAFSNVANTQCTAMIINYFFGTIVNAAFSVANQINGFILMFANSLNTSAVPQITKSLSGGNSTRSVSLTVKISKYTFFLMLFVSFPVLMELDFLLDIWLKEVPVGANYYCILIVLSGILLSVSQGVGSLIAASGKIKVFKIVEMIFTLAVLPLGALAFKMGANAYALSAIICVANLIRIPIVMLLVKKVVDVDIKNDFLPTYRKMVYVFVPLCVLFFLYHPENLSVLGHIGGLVGSLCICVLLVYLLGLDTREKNLVKSTINKIAKKR